MIKYFPLPLILFLFPLFISLPAQNIQFQGEQIDITISETQVRVSGKYYFYNPTSHPVNQPMFYPFIVDHRLTYPDSIDVSLSTSDRSLIYRSHENGIFFSIPFLPEQSLILNVFYSQKALANQYEYILTSTREWNRPLQFAQYLIKISEDMQLVYLSLDYQEKKIQDNQHIYYISRVDFMPKENLKIIWKGKR